MKKSRNEEKIGIVYSPDFLIHTLDQHPERKERLEHILDMLEKNMLTERLKQVKPEAADTETVSLVHDEAYIRSVEKACRDGRQFLDADTYITRESYRVALLAAGGAVTGLREIFEGECSKMFALLRPPGHHAERDRAMGFCLFNNAALAAAVARRDHGLERIAIVDWDVHHGNGTQHIFEEDPAVLYVSLHQSPAFPGTGGTSETGRGGGEGFTVNVPLPAGCGDADYMLFYDRVIVPVLEEYKPELLIVSAGQDAYYRDPLAGMALTHNGYYRMSEALAAVAARYCGGRMLFCLEGGYNLQGQAGAVLQVLNAAGGWGLPITEENPPGEPSSAALRVLEEVLAVQSRYWGSGLS